MIRPGSSVKQPGNADRAEIERFDQPLVTDEIAPPRRADHFGGADQNHHWKGCESARSRRRG
jgi:hypothetical protein